MCHSFVLSRLHHLTHPDPPTSSLASETETLGGGAHQSNQRLLRLRGLVFKEHTKN